MLRYIIWPRYYPSAPTSTTPPLCTISCIAKSIQDDDMVAENELILNYFESFFFTSPGQFPGLVHSQQHKPLCQYKQEMQRT